MSPGPSLAETLEAIRTKNPAINAFTNVTEHRSTRRRSGALAGLPFAVKNLFDVAGLPTLAGSTINRELPPAKSDATAIVRLEEAGATLIGTANMDEYAAGYTTENSHYGATRNPHDVTRVAGGSSGGSAAAVASGLVPLALGSDTGGSIRVPAAFCGVWGLKPTYGRLSRAGTFPFCGSLDTIGPLASSVAVLAAAYDAMQGPDERDPVCSQRASEPVSPQLDAGITGVRIARAGGYFTANVDPQLESIVAAAADAIGARAVVEFPDPERAAAATLLITRSESGQLHLPNLRRRAHDFDPLIRDRLLSNTLIPATWYVKAQRFRRWHHRQLLRLFESVDVVLAPSTPTPAHLIGANTVEVGNRQMLARVAAGLLVAPISLVGLPVINAPLQKLHGLPVGMQIIAAPWREDLCFRVARFLERETIAHFSPAG